MPTGETQVVRIGRAFITMGFAGFVLGAILAVPGGGRLLADTPGLFALFKLTMAVSSFALVVDWGMALHHWGTRYAGPPRHRGRWGLTIILGVFIGSLAYWWLGARETLSAAHR